VLCGFSQKQSPKNNAISACVALARVMVGRGKSGGARVVYDYHNDTIPLYLLAVFAKNEKDNLTKTECTALKKMTAAIVQAWHQRTKP